MKATACREDHEDGAAPHDVILPSYCGPPAILRLLAADARYRSQRRNVTPRIARTLREIRRVSRQRRVIDSFGFDKRGNPPATPADLERQLISARGRCTGRTGDFLGIAATAAT